MPDKKRSGPRLAVGLISGTSMDGVDAVLVKIAGPPATPHVGFFAFENVPYPAETQRRLLRVASGSAITAGEISELNFRLGKIFADAALDVCRVARVSPRHLSVVGSHGQTIYHQGSATLEGRRLASTLQIGEPAVIAERLGVPVVADFRTADIAAGGEGAPLVPMVDYLLLRDAKQGVVALNIGGIANLTVIPARARPEQVFGFDTGPGNMVIDGLVRRATRGRKTLDDGGGRAARGHVIEPLLARLLKHPFFRRRPPKSTGREQFGDEFLDRYFLRARARLEDLLRTATELSARTIAEAITRFVLPRVKVHRLIISGGGVHNPLLVGRLAALLPQLVMEHSNAYGLHVDMKEAIAFALLADRTMHGLPGNLPSVTGARREVVLGKIVRP